MGYVGMVRWVDIMGIGAVVCVALTFVYTTCWSLLSEHSCYLAPVM